MRQDAIVQPDDEDRSELQSLGGMQGQEGGHISFGDRVLIGDQRHILEKLVQAAGGILDRQATQLLDVAPAVHTFLRVIVDVFLVVQV